MKKLALIAATGALLALPQLAASRISSNTVDPTAELSNQGGLAKVGVFLGCDESQRARLRVTLTQRSGALAQGGRKARCATEQKDFVVRAELRGEPGLEPGQARACILALTSDDARQWCKEIVLE